MSGHNKWAQIKHKKGVTDKKRGVLFSKLLAGVTIAARGEPNPEFNPRLRTMIEKAKEAGVTKDKIEAAIMRAADKDSTFEGLLFEAYGPGGVAMVIEAATDSRNRTVAEVKHLLSEHGGKWAETGSVAWTFESPKSGDEAWKPKFFQEISANDSARLDALTEALEEHRDVQRVVTNHR